LKPLKKYWFESGSLLLVERRPLVLLRVEQVRGSV
jgi:hypothetical protein